MNKYQKFSLTVLDYLIYYKLYSCNLKYYILNSFSSFQENENYNNELSHQ